MVAVTELTTGTILMQFYAKLADFVVYINKIRVLSVGYITSG